MSDSAAPIDPYDAVLTDLEGKRAQIEQAIAAIKAIRAGQPLANQEISAAAATPAAVQVTAGMFHGMSIVEAVKQLLSMRKKAMGTQEITEAIIAGGVVFSTATPANTVGSVLHRESVKPSGGIISVARGTWALPSWHTNPGRFRKKTLGETLYPEDAKPDEETS